MEMKNENDPRLAIQAHHSGDDLRLYFGQDNTNQVVAYLNKIEATAFAAAVTAIAKKLN